MAATSRRVWAQLHRRARTGDGRVQQSRREVGGDVGARIGVFGGTFDPVHIGHLVAALDVHHRLELDRMLLVPANAPWQKVSNRTVTPVADRLAMLRAAVEGVDGLDVSTVDIDRGGTTYSADTLADLSRVYPDARLYLVIGSDVAAELDSWVRTDEVKSLAKLAVVSRAGEAPDVASLNARGWRCEVVHGPALEVSSSMIRERLLRGARIEFLVPRGAIHCIEERGLYPRGR